MKRQVKIMVSIGLFLISLIPCSCKKSRYKVETTDIIDVKAYQATLNGFATHIGFKKITERGFCYATTENPDLNDSVLIVRGEGADNGRGGNMTGTVKNLELFTTYYVRAFSKLSNGDINYGNQKEFTTNNKFESGQAGPAGGLIYLVTSSGYYEAIVTAYLPAEWGCRGTFVNTDPSSIYSKLNTQNQVSVCATPATAARRSLEFEKGKFKEWYLAAAQDLIQIYNVQSATPLRTFKTDSVVYWSSTQKDKDNAFAFDFSTGKELIRSKSDLNYIIVVRYIEK